jgi:hypothetical protein
MQTRDRICVYDARYMLGSKAAATARILWRWLSFAFGFAAAGSGVWYGAQQAVSEAQIAELALGFGLIDNAYAFERRVQKKPRPNLVALVGDSTLMNAQGMRWPRKQSLPGRIELSLQKYADAGVSVNLENLIMPGLGPSGMYFACERLIAARPDRVVLALNLHSFSREATRSFAYVESAGWMTSGQLVEALGLPLWDSGLTADRLLLYNALRALGAGDAWRSARGLQARAFRLYAPVAQGLDALFGSDAYARQQQDLGLVRWSHNVVEIDGRKRHRRVVAERIMAPVLTGLSPRHPNLQVLSRVLARLRAAHIPALVYLEPFNVEYLRGLNIPMDGLPRSLRSIRGVVEEQGAQLLDLHDILPDAAFRDEGDHYTFDSEPNGTFLVARRLASQLAGDPPTQQAMNTGHAVQ